MWVCKKCGIQNYENAQFCSNCGTPKNVQERRTVKTSTALSISAVFIVLLLIVIGLKVFPPPQPEPATQLESYSTSSNMPAEIIESSITPFIPEPTMPHNEVATKTMGPFPSGRFSFINGARILIPTGFTDTNSTGDYQTGLDVNGYIYDFYNSDYNMWITLSEAQLSSYANSGKYGANTSEVLKNKYTELVNQRESPTGKALSDNTFVLTGYSGNSIYYTYGVIDKDTLYIIDFLYPTNNREYCDRIVESTEASFQP